MVPTFTTESIDEGGARLDPDSIATPTPQFFDVASPPDRQPGFGVGPHRTSDTGHALHTGPYPSGLSRYWTYGASDSGSSRTPSHHCLPDPSRLTVPARPVRCQGCSHHRVRSHVLAAPSFTSQLRLTSSGVLSPPLDSLAPRGALSGSRTQRMPLICGFRPLVCTLDQTTEHGSTPNSPVSKIRDRRFWCVAGAAATLGAAAAML
jgi:hypothetical protein